MGGARGLRVGRGAANERRVARRCGGRAMLAMRGGLRVMRLLGRRRARGQHAGSRV
jgi:hypothetical protein